MVQFNFNRFLKTLRWVLTVNFRTLLLWTIGSVFGVFMGEMLFLKMAGFPDPYLLIRNYAQFGSVLLMLITLIMASSIVSSINEKCKREAFLMLPSSNLEKYLSLMLYTTVVCMLCVFLAFVVGDSLRMAWFAVSGRYQDIIGVTLKETGETFYWWSSAIPLLLKDMWSAFLVNIGENGFPGQSLLFRVIQTVVFVSFCIWIHSLYTVGGTLLRKYSFVVTSVFFILFMTFSVWFINHFDLMLFRSEWDGDRYIEQEVGTMGYVMAVAFPLLSAFNYWASFHIFKGFQLITNKWFNYDILKR